MNGVEVGTVTAISSRSPAYLVAGLWSVPLHDLEGSMVVRMKDSELKERREK